MDDLERQLGRVRRRLILFRALDWAAWATLGALVVVALLVGVSRLVPALAEWVSASALILAAVVPAAAMAGALASLARRASLIEAALRADERLGLQERLSSALLLGRTALAAAPVYTALEADARRHAASINPRRDFRYRLPAPARHSVWPAMAIGVLLFVPPVSLFGPTQAPAPAPMGRELPPLTERERQEQAAALRQLAREARQSAQETDAAADLELAARLERLSREVEMGIRDRKDALAEMSRLNDELKVEQQRLQREKQPFRQLRGLQQADQTRDIQKALKDGDFAKAAEKMAELSQKIGQMDAAEKQQLAKELEQLAESLKDSPAMAEALRQAAEAVEQMARQQQQQQAGGQQSSEQGAGEKRPDQSPAAQSAGQKSQPGQKAGGKAGEGKGSESQQQDSASADAAAEAMQQAAQQMRDLQQMARQMQRLEQLQKSLTECQSQCAGGNGTMGNSSKPGSSASASSGANQSGEMVQSGSASQQAGSQPSQGAGQFVEGFTPSESMGSGGPGRGQGGNPPDDGSQATAFVDTFIQGDKHDGEIIGIFDTDAPVPVGESRLNFETVPPALRQRAADSIKETEIPAGYRGPVRNYFEAIRSGAGASN